MKNIYMMIRNVLFILLMVTGGASMGQEHEPSEELKNALSHELYDFIVIPDIAGGSFIQIEDGLHSVNFDLGKFFSGNVYLEKNQLLSPDAVIMHNEEPGNSANHEITVKTYIAKNQYGIEVGRVNFDGQFWSGYITNKTGEQVCFQKLSDFTETTSQAYVVYLASDLVTSSEGCGMVGDALKMTEHSHYEYKTAAATATCFAVEIALEADWQFSQARTDEYNYMLSTINIAEGFYLNNFNLRFIVVYMNVWDVAADPYRDDSFTAAQLVTDFGNWWNTNRTFIRRDIAYIFTGRATNITDNFIGWANGFGLVGQEDQSYAMGVNLSSVTYSGNLAAHEFGHLYNAVHCNATNCTNSSITCNFGTSGSPTLMCNAVPSGTGVAISAANQTSISNFIASSTPHPLIDEFDAIDYRISILGVTVQLPLISGNYPAGNTLTVTDAVATTANSWVNYVGGEKVVLQNSHFSVGTDGAVRAFLAENISDCGLPAPGAKLYIANEGQEGNGETGAADNISDLHVYPHPVNLEATVAWTADKEGQYVLLLSDLLGKKLITLGKGYAGKSESVMEQINFSGIASGIYVLILKAENGTIKTQKIVVTN